MEERNAAGKVFDWTSLDWIKDLGMTATSTLSSLAIKSEIQQQSCPSVSRSLSLDSLRSTPPPHQLPAEPNGNFDSKPFKTDMQTSSLLESLTLELSLLDGIRNPSEPQATNSWAESAAASLTYQSHDALPTFNTATVADTIQPGSEATNVVVPLLSEEDDQSSIHWLTPFAASGSGGGDPPGGFPPIERGFISITCFTFPPNPLDSAPTLPISEKQDPGWLSNVNWSDDDNDGWNPESTESTTADPNAIYTPDRDDTFITGGDPDLRKFIVTVCPQDALPGHDYTFRLTFPSSVGVYEENTKAYQVTSGQTFHVSSKTFWLEGRTASTEFRDVTLAATYLGADIPMLVTTDTVKVTVFGVEQKGIFAGGQQPDDPKRFMAIPSPPSHDENGQISWDLPQYLAWSNRTPPENYCMYFADAMEMQSTVKPPRDANPSVYAYGKATSEDDPTIPIPPVPPNLVNPSPSGSVVFTQERWLLLRGWQRKTNDPPGSWTQFFSPGETAPKWVDDFTNFKGFQANVVTSTASGSHLYFPDAPGYTGNDQLEFSHQQTYRDFRNAVFIIIYDVKLQVSDWSRWHSIIFLKPKDVHLTRAPNVPAAPPITAKVRQDFGTDWIPKGINRDEDYLNW